MLQGSLNEEKRRFKCKTNLLSFLSSFITLKAETIIRKCTKLARFGIFCSGTSTMKLRKNMCTPQIRVAYGHKAEDHTSSAQKKKRHSKKKGYEVDSVSPSAFTTGPFFKGFAFSLYIAKSPLTNGSRNKHCGYM